MSLRRRRYDRRLHRRVWNELLSVRLCSWVEGLEAGGVVSPLVIANLSPEIRACYRLPKVVSPAGVVDDWKLMTW